MMRLLFLCTGLRRGSTRSRSQRAALASRVQAIAQGQASSNRPLQAGHSS
jgi:hypothetical protein